MRWVIVTGMYNVADLAAEFCSYHLGLGVDQILVADYGSTDRTPDILRPFCDAGQVQLIPIPTHHFATYDPSNSILEELRKKKSVDWVSFLDPDEFLVGPADLKIRLSAQWSRGLDAMAVPRHNMIAEEAPDSQSHYLSHLTLKVLTTDERVSDARATLSSPWIFSRIPAKVMISVRSRLTTITGDHAIAGHKSDLPRLNGLQILHYPIRGFEAFRQKVEDTKDYLAANPEFGPGTGWHWRRWIGLLEKGQLREEYENQFLDLSLAESLIAKEYIVREMRLADWLRTTIR